MSNNPIRTQKERIVRQQFDKLFFQIGFFNIVVFVFKKHKAVTISSWFAVVFAMILCQYFLTEPEWVKWSFLVWASIWIGIAVLGGIDKILMLRSIEKIYDSSFILCLSILEEILTEAEFKNILDEIIESNNKS